MWTFQICGISSGKGCKGARIAIVHGQSEQIQSAISRKHLLLQHNETIPRAGLADFWDYKNYQISSTNTDQLSIAN